MNNRSAAAAATRQKILCVTLELATEKLTVEIVLADVAYRADVTVQTILRHFKTRDALFEAVVAFGGRDVTAERETPVGDYSKAIEVIVDHYELRGDWVLALLGQELSDERIRGITVPGKLLHRTWVDTVFEPQVTTRTAASREEMIDLLVVATDVYCWKLLRRDQGHSRARTEQTMRLLVEAILAIPSAEQVFESE